MAAAVVAAAESVVVLAVPSFDDVASCSTIRGNLAKLEELVEDNYNNRSLVNNKYKIIMKE